MDARSLAPSLTRGFCLQVRVGNMHWTIRLYALNYIHWTIRLFQEASHCWLDDDIEIDVYKVHLHDTTATTDFVLISYNMSADHSRRVTSIFLNSIVNFAARTREIWSRWDYWKWRENLEVSRDSSYLALLLSRRNHYYLRGFRLIDLKSYFLTVKKYFCNGTDDLEYKICDQVWLTLCSSLIFAFTSIVYSISPVYPYPVENLMSTIMQRERCTEFLSRDCKVFALRNLLQIFWS